MSNVFPPADLKKNNKQIKAILVAVIYGLQFTSLQNFTTIVSLFTSCAHSVEKRKSTGQIQEMKLPVELETHKKRKTAQSQQELPSAPLQS